MQQTFQVNASELDNRFIKSVQDIFGDRKLKMVVEDERFYEPGWHSA